MGHFIIRGGESVEELIFLSRVGWKQRSMYGSRPLHCEVLSASPISFTFLTPSVSLT